jgi:5-methylcytosine-specific restriction endonuclease McrA
MPYRAPSIRACGCVVPSGQRCEHAIARDRERKARFDQQRPTARQRGYDSKWDSARKGFLAKHPRCSRCEAPATVVDHKTPHRGDRKLFWDKTNWQPLCAHHHNSGKQSEEKRS